MAYTKQTVNSGDTITANWGNYIQTQYDEAKADLDAKMHPTTGHKHTGAAGDGPLVTNLGAPTGSGSGTITSTTPLTVTHNLGRIPIVQAVFSYPGIGVTSRISSITTTNFVLSTDTTSSVTVNYWYW